MQTHRASLEISRFAIWFFLTRPAAKYGFYSLMVGLLAIQVQAQQTNSEPRIAKVPTAASSGELRFQRIFADSESVSTQVIRLDKIPGNQERPVVTAMCVSANGELLAAAGDDHAIRIVNLKTGQTQATLMGHRDWVQCAEFSPSNNLLATCSHDGTLRTWSVTDVPRSLQTYNVEHALLTLAFLDDEQLYTAGFGSNIYRLNTHQNTIRIDHTCECNDIRSITCTPDRLWMAYGGRDGIIRIRPTAVNESPTIGHDEHAGERTIPLHFHRIRSIQFSADGNQLTSVGEDRRIVHYDMLQRKATRQTEIGGGKLMGLCQLEPNLFAIAGSDNSIRIYSDIDQRVLVKLVGHDGSVCILKKTGNHIISGSFDTTIRIWDIDQAISSSTSQGRYVHPVASQFEDSGAGDDIK